MFSDVSVPDFLVVTPFGVGCRLCRCRVGATVVARHLQMKHSPFALSKMEVEGALAERVHSLRKYGRNFSEFLVPGTREKQQMFCSDCFRAFGTKQDWMQHLQTGGRACREMAGVMVGCRPSLCYRKGPSMVRKVPVLAKQVVKASVCPGACGALTLEHGRVPEILMLGRGESAVSVPDFLVVTPFGVGCRLCRCSVRATGVTAHLQKKHPPCALSKMEVERALAERVLSLRKYGTNLSKYLVRGGREKRQMFCSDCFRAFGCKRYWMKHLQTGGTGCRKVAGVMVGCRPSLCYRKGPSMVRKVPVLVDQVVEASVCPGPCGALTLEHGGVPKTLMLGREESAAILAPLAREDEDIAAKALLALDSGGHDTPILQTDEDRDDPGDIIVNMDDQSESEAMVLAAPHNNLETPAANNLPPPATASMPHDKDGSHDDGFSVPIENDSGDDENDSIHSTSIAENPNKAIIMETARLFMRPGRTTATHLTGKFALLFFLSTFHES